MSVLLISKQKHEEALYLLKSCLLCSIKVLGPYHIKTAEVERNFGQFYLKWDKRDNALKHIEKAFYIYENYFAQKHNLTTSVAQADLAMQVANIMEEQNRLQEALQFVTTAKNKYFDVYGSASDNSILAQWLKLQIEYSVSNGVNSTVVDNADLLLKSLIERDKLFLKKYETQLKQSFDIEDKDVELLLEDHHYFVDELKVEMEKIKIMCIATHIMEMTRMQNNVQKKFMISYLNRIIDLQS